MRYLIPQSWITSLRLPLPCQFRQLIRDIGPAGQSVWSQIAGKMVNEEYVERATGLSGVTFAAAVTLLTFATFAPMVLNQEGIASRCVLSTGWCLLQAMKTCHGRHLAPCNQGLQASLLAGCPAPHLGSRHERVSSCTVRIMLHVPHQCTWPAS